MTSFNLNNYPIYADAYHSSDSIGSVIEHLDLIKAWKVIYDTSKEIVAESHWDYPLAFRRWIKHLFPEIFEEQKEENVYVYRLSLKFDRETVDRIFMTPFLYMYYEESWDTAWEQGNYFLLTVDLSIPNGNLLEAIKNLHQHVKDCKNDEKGDHHNFG